MGKGITKGTSLYLYFLADLLTKKSIKSTFLLNFNLKPENSFNYYKK
jgi:hypothetical protein